MTRIPGLLAAAGLCLSFAAAALAAPPAVLDRVPDTAALAIAIPAPETFQKNLTALTKAVEFPMPLPEVKDLLQMGGMVDGVDPSKSMGLVVFPPEPKKPGDKPKADAEGDEDLDLAGEEDRVVVLIPVTDYNKLMAGFNVPLQAEPGPVAATLPDGQTAFFMDAGNGYAAMSPKKELLAEFAKAPATGKLKNGMGPLGVAVSESHDVVIVGNMEVLRPLIPAMREEIQKQAEERTAAMGGAGAEQLDNPAFNWLIDQLAKDAKGFTAGLKTGTMGVSLDLALNFPKDSTAGQIFAAGGAAGSLMGKIPSAPYLAAGAIDVSNPALKSLLKEFSEKAAAHAKEAGGPPNLAGGTQSFLTGEGHAAILGFNSAMAIGGGVFTNTVSYTKAADPAAHIAAVRDELKTLNGTTVDNMSITTSFTPAGAKVGETAVDVWESKIKMDEGEGGMNPMVMLFGPAGGPNGFLAPVDGGVYRTFSRNSTLMASAFKAGKGENTLGADTFLAQVAQQMPKDRIAEAYVGTKSILDLVVPLTAMFGVQIDPALMPENLPPVGAAIAGKDGQGHLNIFIPAPVLKTGIGIGLALQSQLDGMGDMGEMGEEAEPAPAEKKGAGQPRF
jgi:hypothetical protein